MHTPDITVVTKTTVFDLSILYDTVVQIERDLLHVKPTHAVADALAVAVQTCRDTMTTRAGKEPVSRGTGIPKLLQLMREELQEYAQSARLTHTNPLYINRRLMAIIMMTHQLVNTLELDIDIDVELEPN